MVAKSFADFAPGDGRYFIVKRPPMSRIWASLHSPVDEPVKATFHVVRSKNPDSSHTTQVPCLIRSLTRSLDEQTVWFGGYEIRPGGAWLAVSGQINLGNQLHPPGILVDGLAKPKRDIGALPPLRIGVAERLSAAVIKNLLGDKSPARQIVIEVINQVSQGTWLHGLACPDCHETVTSASEDKPLPPFTCPIHGNIDHAAYLVGFPPVAPDIFV